jgi:hypothetical protein
MTPHAFEQLARKIMEQRFRRSLAPKRMLDVPKTFDLVSEDDRIVGDAKYLTLVRGERLPPAKFSVIAEYVWLLEKTSADTKFLVFGNDRRVPAKWLKQYGHLASDVLFYFLTDDGKLEDLSAVG